MQTAKIFKNGKSQAVRLPKEFRFDCDEVGIQKVGGMVYLFEKDKAWENFLACEPCTDEFFEIMMHRNDDEVPDAPRAEFE
ncbi:MAG: type II toxin-antitoxin system VapB family antitoxin [Oscillospiraceae bacterium]|jgi:antitoxin VapB|nr:type II toxin-antitoxin system VapB family antitoxin [Oscillospiraceae bacterium]